MDFTSLASALLLYLLSLRLFSKIHSVLDIQNVSHKNPNSLVNPDQAQTVTNVFLSVLHRSRRLSQVCYFFLFRKCRNKKHVFTKEKPLSWFEIKVPHQQLCFCGIRVSCDMLSEKHLAMIQSCISHQNFTFIPKNLANCWLPHIDVLFSKRWDLFLLLWNRNALWKQNKTISTMSVTKWDLKIIVIETCHFVMELLETLHHQILWWPCR